MSIGIWQLVIILAIVIILFGGRGKISAILRDLGKGLKSFKNEVSGDDKTPSKKPSKRKNTAKRINNKKIK